MRAFLGFILGLVFGIGLIIAQMTNPAKVIAFLDVLDGWDPSLAFVMASGLLVFGFGFAVLKSRKVSILGHRIQIPHQKSIDRPLIIGSVLFGLGWGLVGLCPGPAIAVALVGGGSAISFLIAMIIGMALHHVYERHFYKRHQGET